MPGNIDPIFSRVGDVTYDASTGMGQPISAAANDYTGAGANNTLVFTSDTTNGSFLRALRFKAVGTNVATVARIFLNNGSTNATSTNNSFFGEIALPSTTASSSGATSYDIEYAFSIPLPPGFKVYVGLGTAVAAGWVVVPIAGKY